jgi:predicted ATPase
VRLIDRNTEKQALHQVLDSVRAGMSGALVLRGEPGVGKSVLLDYSVERATGLQVVRTVAVESEMALGFAAVHQLLVPFLHSVDRLPEPQQRALGVAFGLVNGPPADLFKVGLAVLMLLADAARARPVLCVIDDAQWLDSESSDVLGFVARRLLADGVGMLFAIRETEEPDPHLQGLPGLRLAGLPKQDAQELLESSTDRPADAAVAERIIVETGGNPLAIVEAVAQMTPEQLGGREPLPEPLPVGHQVEDLFLRRVRELPTDTRTLLLLAAAERPGRGDRLWQAAGALGIPESAAVPAEGAGFPPPNHLRHSCPAAPLHGEDAP